MCKVSLRGNDAPRLFFFLQIEPPLQHLSRMVGLSQKDSYMGDVDGVDESQSKGASCPWNTSSDMVLSPTEKTWRRFGMTPKWFLHGSIEVPSAAQWASGADHARDHGYTSCVWSFPGGVAALWFWSYQWHCDGLWRSVHPHYASYYTYSPPFHSILCVDLH